MVSRTTALLATAIAMASSQQALANNDLAINGFLSVGAAMLTNDDVTVGGHDDKGGFKQDTILGIQMSKRVNSSTSLTGQLVSRGAEDYDTEAAWAYATYAANENLDLRMGRLRLPLYYYSDFLEVGYAYDWVRPPEEVYAVPISSFDGADATYSFVTGSFDNSLQVYFGRTQSQDLNIDVSNLAGLVLTSARGNMTYRLSYLHGGEINIDDVNAVDPATATISASITTAGSAINNALVARGYSAAEIAKARDNIESIGGSFNYYGLAAAYDNGDISLIAEATQAVSEMDAIPDVTSYMVKAGKRFDDITVHLTYADIATSTESGATGDVQELLNLENEQSSIIAGLRYDYDASTAFKFELQQHDEETVFGIGENDESGTLISVALDLVF